MFLFFFMGLGKIKLNFCCSVCHWLRRTHTNIEGRTLSSRKTQECLACLIFLNLRKFIPFLLQHLPLRTKARRLLRRKNFPTKEDTQESIICFVLFKPNCKNVLHLFVSAFSSQYHRVRDHSLRKTWKNFTLQ